MKATVLEEKDTNIPPKQNHISQGLKNGPLRVRYTKLQMIERDNIMGIMT